MELLLQFGILMGVSFLGEGLATLLPLPVPASIYALLLLLIGLLTGIIPLHRVKQAGSYLLLILPLLFIPPSAALIEQGTVLLSLALPLVLTGILSTALVMVVTGWVAQTLIRRKGSRK